MNRRVYNALMRKEAYSLGSWHITQGDRTLEGVDKLLRYHLNDQSWEILKNMKQRAEGKAIGASVGGLGGIIAGLLLAKDKDLLHKILYSGGLGLLSAGAGSVLGDTISDYAFMH